MQTESRRDDHVVVTGGTGDVASDDKVVILASDRAASDDKYWFQVNFWYPVYRDAHISPQTTARQKSGEILMYLCIMGEKPWWGFA